MASSSSQREVLSNIVKRRANAKRGITDGADTSTAPVKAVRKAFEVLRTLNRLRIASIGDLHGETNFPKPTIVRLLDTLIADGYVVRDNMCGGYRIGHQVRELDSGYAGISEIIDAARLFAIDLTNRIKWPVSIGTLDGDAMLVQFWTGSISPWVNDDSLLRRRPNLMSSAMGRSYLAFCPDDERETILAALRKNPDNGLDLGTEQKFRALLKDFRKKGYALRAADTEPRRNTTLAMPLRRAGTVMASMSVSFFTSAVPGDQIEERIVEPLRTTIDKIEGVMAYIRPDSKSA